MFIYGWLVVIYEGSYFCLCIIYDGIPVEVVFDIRDKGIKQYKYSISIKEKQNLQSDYFGLNMPSVTSTADFVSDNNISNKDNDVNCDIDNNPVKYP